ncbi:MAG: ATP-dependent helicase, partial [Nitrosopumilus sp.]|nr:ATP-dependent helicase [Nitrosopumilus sp.]
ELVVNYDVPNQEMAYFHRIGRTARAGTEGRAITFVSYSSVGDWNIIKRQIKVPLRDLNQEMNIEISIPDPLKRQSSSRRYGGGGGSRSNYSRGGRGGGGGYGRGGGGGYGRNTRDDRGSKRKDSGDGKNSYGGRSRW